MTFKMVLTPLSIPKESDYMSGARASPSSLNTEKDSWWKLILTEDNFRFLLLALLITLYMIIGAAIFQSLEANNELAEKERTEKNIAKEMKEVEVKLQDDNIALKDILKIVYIWGNATKNGLIGSKQKWDYAGSFHFVYTIVSTIGFGATAPSTLSGRIFCIFYGLFGCSSGILFFNLYLERIISIFAYFMRANYERRLRRKSCDITDLQRADQREELLDTWKPSVYWIIVYMSILSIVVGAIAAVIYMEIEKWTYVESMYFCFVTFATIGFGDYVSAQQPNTFYGYGVRAYQFGNFIIMVFGCCCIYSLFNVLSIAIKQFLNWIIFKIQLCFDSDECVNYEESSGSVTSIGKQNSVRNRSEMDTTSYNDDSERKFSKEIFTTLQSRKSEIIKHPNFSKKQKISTSSAISRRSHHHEEFTSTEVGPLAIATSRLKK